MSVPEVDPFKQHLELPRGDLLRRFFGLGPRKTMFLKLLLPEAKPILVPVECLDDSTVAIAKQEYSTRQRILVHLLTRHDRKAVDSFTHVCSAGANVYIHPM